MPDFPEGGLGPNRGKSSAETFGLFVGIVIILALIAWFGYGVGMVFFGVWNHDEWGVLIGVLNAVAALSIFKLLAWVGRFLE